MTISRHKPKEDFLLGIKIRDFKTMKSVTVHLIFRKIWNSMRKFTGLLSLVRINNAPAGI